jgi:CBS-domain-containing membrane protein
MRVVDVMVTRPKRHPPESGLEEIRALFEDDHVHMALIVDQAGRLVTTIERPDLADTAAAAARELGTLAGRTVRPSAALAAITSALVHSKRRRLAVVDDVGRLLGLLCLKRDGTGYCSDEGIRERA